MDDSLDVSLVVRGFASAVRPDPPPTGTGSGRRGPPRPDPHRLRTGSAWREYAGAGNPSISPVWCRPRDSSLRQDGLTSTRNSSLSDPPSGFQTPSEGPATKRLAAMCTDARGPRQAWMPQAVHVVRASGLVAAVALNAGKGCAHPSLVVHHLEAVLCLPCPPSGGRGVRAAPTCY